MKTAADRLKQARVAAGYASAADAARAFGWNVNTYSSNENGNAPFSYKKAAVYAQAFRVRPEWLYDGKGPMKGKADQFVPIIGRVGADTSGEVIFTTGQVTGDLAPIPPGGSADAAALEVTGGSMPWLARDGSLVYFETQRTPPTPDLLGYPVVVETEDGRVLVKLLLRGSGKGLYDLQSESGQIMSDVRLVWAAEITAIIPPKQARRIIIRAGSSAA